MYAIIRTGGKQYKVAPGDVIRIEKIAQDLGSEVEFKEVLFVGGDDNSAVGNPTVAKALVTGVITQQARDKKVLVFKKKRRKGFRKTKGHRQPYTEVFVSAITGADGKTVKADSKPVVKDPNKSKEKKAAKPKTKTAKVAKKATSAKKKVTKKAGAKKKAVSKKKKTTKKA